MSNQRLKKLMKELKIPQLKIPPPPEPIILSGIHDHLLPKQIAEELAAREDIVEIAYIPPYGRRTRCQYRVTFKRNEDFNVHIFYV